MTKIYNTKSIFIGDLEISIGDSILEEGVVLDIQNIEYPENKLRLELSWEEFDNLKQLVNSIVNPNIPIYGGIKSGEFPKDKYVVGYDPYKEDGGGSFGCGVMAIITIKEID